MRRPIARKVKYHGEHSPQIFGFVSILSSYEITSENNSIIVLRQRDAFLQQVIIYPRGEPFVLITRGGITLKVGSHQPRTRATNYAGATMAI